jgi:hypothetical protein
MVNKSTTDDSRSLAPDTSRRNVLKGVVGTVGGLTVGTALESGVARAANWDQLTDVAVYVDGHTYEDYGYDPAWTLQTLLQDAFAYNEIQAHAVTVVRDGGGFDLREQGYQDSDGNGRYDVGQCTIKDDFRGYLKSNNLYADHEDHHLIYHHEDKLAGCGGSRVSVGHGDQLANLSGAPFDPDRFDEHVRGPGTTTPGDAAFVSMQEVGHSHGLCDGSDHDCGMHYDKYDVENGEVHGTTKSDLPDTTDAVYSTPMGATLGGYNQCDQYADDATSSTYVTEYTDAWWWYRCAGTQLRDKFPRVHTFTIESAGEYVSYDFTVSGSVLGKSTKCNATKNSGDSISGDSASGEVNNGGRDTYLFGGDITSFSASKGDYAYNLYVKCQEVVEESVGNNLVTIDGVDDGDWEHYDITSSRGLRKTTANGASIQDGDQITTTNGGKNTRADGAVYGGKDSYLYWGGILKSGFDDGGAYVTYDSV